MRSLLPACLFLLSASLPLSNASAAPSFDVALDNRAYADVVKTAFSDRRIPFRFVKQPAPGVPSVTIRASHSEGCSAEVSISSDSMTSVQRRSQSMLFRSEASRQKKCKEILADMLRDVLAWF